MLPSDDAERATRAGQVWLEVHAVDRATELFVLDARRQELVKACGRLEAGLPPGIYRLKARAGSVVREEYLLLRLGSPVVKQIEPVAFASAAPLLGTLKTREYHIAAASQHSRSVGIDRGSGSGIFLFARDWRAPESGSARKHPFADIELADAAGQVVVGRDRVEGADETEVPDAWSARKIALAPGLYRLRTGIPGAGRVEQTIVAAPGWQTQVFVLREPSSDTGTLVCEPMRAAIFFSLLGSGFTPESGEDRQVELARIGVANGRRVLERDFVEDMVSDGFSDPMLGILAGHQLRLGGDLDQDLLQRLVNRLRAMVGPSHPDVEALALLCGRTEHVFTAPPMLSKSWDIVIEASRARPRLVPAGSLSSRVSGRLWGHGAWLLWEHPPEVEVPWVPSPLRAALKAVIPEGLLAFRRPRVGESWLVPGYDEPSASEAALLALAVPAHRDLPLWARPRVYPAQIAVFSRAREAMSAVEPELARALALPANVLRDAAAALREQIGIEPWPKTLDVDAVKRHMDELERRARRSEHLGQALLSGALRSGAQFWRGWLAERASGSERDQLLELLRDLEPAETGDWDEANEPLGWPRAHMASVPGAREARSDAELARRAAMTKQLEARYRAFLAAPSERLGREIVDGIDEAAVSAPDAHYVRGVVYGGVERHDRAELHYLLALLGRPFKVSYAILLAYEQAERTATAAMETLRAVRRALWATPQLDIHLANLAWRAHVEEGSLLWSLLSDVGRALLATRESSAQLTHHERIMGFMIPAFYLRLHGNPAEGLGLIDEALFVLPDEDTLRVTRAMLLVDVDPQLGRAALLALQSGKGGRAIAASTPGARLMIWCMLAVGAIHLSTRAFRDARWALVRVPIEALPALVRDREAREAIERAARWAQGNEEPPDLAPEVITNAYFRQRIQRVSAAVPGDSAAPAAPAAPVAPAAPAAPAEA